MDNQVIITIAVESNDHLETLRVLAVLETLINEVQKPEFKNRYGMTITCCDDFASLIVKHEQSN